MNYKITCPHCKAKNTFSSHTDDKYVIDGEILYEWECPSCEEIIQARHKPEKRSK
jgi:phage FluMu protein Com